MQSMIICPSVLFIFKRCCKKQFSLHILYGENLCKTFLKLSLQLMNQFCQFFFLSGSIWVFNTLSTVASLCPLVFRINAKTIFCCTFCIGKNNIEHEVDGEVGKWSLMTLLGVIGFYLKKDLPISIQQLRLANSMKVLHCTFSVEEISINYKGSSPI